MLDPVNASTLSESTTRYDSLGRTIATTNWLTPRGQIDPLAPPIAGLNGVPPTDGLTTQYHYDDNLADGVGLDSSVGILPGVLPSSNPTWKVSLSTAITKLAAAESAGGKLTELYPDHVAGSTVGQTGYGVVTFVYDPAGRVSRKQDQKGDTCTFNYDLAGHFPTGSTALPPTVLRALSPIRTSSPMTEPAEC